MVLPALVDEDATRVVLAFLDRAALGRFAATSEAADALVDDAPWEALYLDDVGRPRAAATRARPPAWWRRKTSVWRAVAGLAAARPARRICPWASAASRPRRSATASSSRAARALPLLGPVLVLGRRQNPEQAGYCPRGAATDGAGRSARAPRWQHTAVNAGGAAWFFGGEVDDAREPFPRWDCEASLFRVTLERGATVCARVVASGDAVAGSSGHSCVADEARKRLVFFGGRVGPGGACTADVRHFDYERLAWRGAVPVDGRPPAPRWCHACAALGSGGSFVVAGGWSNPTAARFYFDDCHVLEGGAWSELGADVVRPPKRTQACCWHIPAAASRGYVLLFGGAAAEPGWEVDPRDPAGGGAEARSRLLFGGKREVPDACPEFLDQISELRVTGRELHACLPSLGDLDEAPVDDDPDGFDSDDSATWGGLGPGGYGREVFL
ncbi:hypothetical protein JL721_10153 [Aureococcus anophagefferens]|nr:hypothetical protein JL721_10153 [Aureococcus anophagefferens]